MAVTSHGSWLGGGQACNRDLWLGAVAKRKRESGLLMRQLVSPCSDEWLQALFLVDLLQNHSVYRQLSTFQSDLKIRITSKRRRVPSSVFNNRTVAKTVETWSFYIDGWMCFCGFQVFQVVQAVDNHDDRHQIHCCPWNARFEFDPGPQPSQEL